VRKASQGQGADLITELLSKRLSNTEWLSYLKSLCHTEEFMRGLSELEAVIEGLHLFGVPDAFVQITPALARGLNYYTGTVFEAKLLDYPELGSISAGGRYANLAGTFTSKKLAY
jgi:histidyl-tRNA synthetase